MSILARLEPDCRLAVHATRMTPSPAPMVTVEITQAGISAAGFVLDPEMARTLADLLIDAAAIAERMIPSVADRADRNPTTAQTDLRVELVALLEEIVGACRKELNCLPEPAGPEEDCERIRSEIAAILAAAERRIEAVRAGSDTAEPVSPNDKDRSDV